MVRHSENDYWYRPFARPIDGKRVHYRIQFGTEILEGIGVFQVQQMKDAHSIAILRTDSFGSASEPIFRLLEIHTALISPHPNPDVAEFLFLETPLSVTRSPSAPSTPFDLPAGPKPHRVLHGSPGLEPTIPD